MKYPSTWQWELITYILCAEPLPRPFKKDVTALKPKPQQEGFFEGFLSKWKSTTSQGRSVF